MRRKILATNVFDAAVERMYDLYSQGHRVVVSFSGGKDSGVCLEICLIAARKANRLPVDVVMRDEEIMYPGTYEYAERVANRSDINFKWIYACQPVINVFNREKPYFWVFDPLLPPHQWVREPPKIATRIEQLNIEFMTIPERFPVDDGKQLFAVIGLRASESRGRMYGIFSSNGYITKTPNQFGVLNARPIYDWTDGDVWKAIHDNKWDYNDAYDVMTRLGVPRHALRIAPPTMNAISAKWMGTAARAWPMWFEKVCNRLDGVRVVAKFGMRAVTPQRRYAETWEQCFKRTCIDQAPQWIRERSLRLMEVILSNHAHHTHEPFPEAKPCYVCYGNMGCWKSLATTMYNGDPFSQKVSNRLPQVEPEYFREGAGYWYGTAAFS